MTKIKKRKKIWSTSVFNGNFVEKKKKNLTWRWFYFLHFNGPLYIIFFITSSQGLVTGLILRFLILMPGLLELECNKRYITIHKNGVCLKYQTIVTIWKIYIWYNFFAMVISTKSWIVTDVLYFTANSFSVSRKSWTFADKPEYQKYFKTHILFIDMKLLASQVIQYWISLDFWGFWPSSNDVLRGLVILSLLGGIIVGLKTKKGWYRFCKFKSGFHLFFLS